MATQLEFDFSPSTDTLVDHFLGFGIDNRLKETASVLRHRENQAQTKRLVDGLSCEIRMPWRKKPYSPPSQIGTQALNNLMLHFNPPKTVDGREFGFMGVTGTGTYETISVDGYDITFPQKNLKKIQLTMYLSHRRNADYGARTASTLGEGRVHNRIAFQWEMTFEGNMPRFTKNCSLAWQRVYHDPDKNRDPSLSPVMKSKLVPVSEYSAAAFCARILRIVGIDAWMKEAGTKVGEHYRFALPYAIGYWLTSKACYNISDLHKKLREQLGDGELSTGTPSYTGSRLWKDLVERLGQAYGGSIFERSTVLRQMFENIDQATKYFAIGPINELLYSDKHVDYWRTNNLQQGLMVLSPYDKEVNDLNFVDLLFSPRMLQVAGARGMNFEVSAAELRINPSRWAIAQTGRAWLEMRNAFELTRVQKLADSPIKHLPFFYVFYEIVHRYFSDSLSEITERYSPAQVANFAGRIGLAPLRALFINQLPKVSSTAKIRRMFLELFDTCNNPTGGHTRYVGDLAVLISNYTSPRFNDQRERVPVDFRELRTIQVMHDHLSKVVTKISTPYIERRNKSYDVFNKYELVVPGIKDVEATIVLPTCNHDMVEWGTVQRHCIGSAHANYINQENYVYLGIWDKKTTSWIGHMQVVKSGSSAWRINQFYAYGNAAVPTQFRDPCSHYVTGILNGTIEPNLVVAEEEVKELVGSPA